VETTLHSRLTHVVGRTTFKSLADLTNTNAESVRRYMNGHEPSTEFLTRVCRAMGVSGHWLLTGRGPMRENEMTQQALRQAEAADLLHAMAETMQRMVERVECLERYVQQIDARVRARPTPLDGATSRAGDSHELRTAPACAEPSSVTTPRTVVSLAGLDAPPRGSHTERPRSDAR